MKKVFHIVSHFDVGGAERVAVSIASSCTEDFEYHIVELYRAHSEFTRVLIDELKERGIRYHRCLIPEFHFHYLVERLAAMLFPLWFLPLFLRHRPAAVHCHTEMPELAVSWFFRLFPWLLKRCNVVRTIHNTRLWTGIKGTGRWVERFFIRRNASVSISLAVRDSYLNAYGQPTPIIYNGVSEVTQRPFKGLVEGKMNVLFAGRFEPQKGISTLVEVIKKMRDDGRYHFHLIGDGSLRPWAERELAALDCVTFHAPVHGLSAYLASFTCLFMPSEFEGLSILAIEAAMAGLPVVGSDCPGLYETMPQQWPLQSKDNDIQRYIDIFSSFIPTADMAQLGRIAHAFAAEHFGVRRMQLRYETLYRGESLT